MTCFEAHITNPTIEFFKRNKKTLLNYNEINSLIKEVSGINSFFFSQKESSELLENISEYNLIVAESDRREYGDFQTNMNLSKSVVNYVFSKHKDLSDWAIDGCNFVIENGISDGTRPKDLVTREELWTMLKRFNDLK